MLTDNWLVYHYRLSNDGVSPSGGHRIVSVELFERGSKEDKIGRCETLSPRLSPLFPDMRPSSLKFRFVVVLSRPRSQRRCESFRLAPQPPRVDIDDDQAQDHHKRRHR